MTTARRLMIAWWLAPPVLAWVHPRPLLAVGWVVSGCIVGWHAAAVVVEEEAP